MAYINGKYILYKKSVISFYFISELDKRKM